MRPSVAADRHDLSRPRPGPSSLPLPLSPLVSADAAVGRKLLWIFLDGVGWGADDEAVNPLARGSWPHLEQLAGGRWVAGDRLPPRAHPLDACLGVPGLPASGSGQVSLLTGVNAAALLGEHRGPYPGGDLHPLLAACSVPALARRAGATVAFANAFPDRYLSRIAGGRARLGAFSRAALLADVPLRGQDDLAAGRAVSANFGNRSWPADPTRPAPPDIDAAEGGRRLAGLALDHDLTIFEHWATDWAGHHPDRWPPATVLAELDAFLGGVLAVWPPEATLVIASDHGNLEDLSTGRHTRNPALCLWYGAAPDRPLRSLTDLAPAMLAAMGLGPGPEAVLSASGSLPPALAALPAV